jgi:hypothetical protein
MSAKIAKTVRKILRQMKRDWSVGMPLPPPRHVVLAPLVLKRVEGHLVASPQGEPPGLYLHPTDLPSGWCVVFTEDSRYPKRKRVISLERALKMSDEELSRVVRAQSVAYKLQAGSEKPWLSVGPPHFFSRG